MTRFIPIYVFDSAYYWDDSGCPFSFLGTIQFALQSHSINSISMMIIESSIVFPSSILVYSFITLSHFSLYQEWCFCISLFYDWECSLFLSVYEIIHIIHHRIKQIQILSPLRVVWISSYFSLFFSIRSYIRTIVLWFDWIHPFLFHFRTLCSLHSLISWSINIQKWLYWYIEQLLF